MKIGVVLPVGGSDGPGGTVPGWRDTLAVARAVEDQGLDSGWIPDHFFYRAEDGREVGMNEAWTMLTAVAASTSRIEIGPIVLCASFRNPGITAKMAAALDDVSNGRLILGVGCGWHEPEYTAFGLPFDRRVGRFEEWLEILARLLRSERVTLAGEFHQADDAVLVPPPQRPIPILIAATRPRMLRLTARWADAWNTAWFGEPNDRLKERLADFDAAVEAEARPSGPPERTIGIMIRDPDQPPVEEPEEEAFAGDIDGIARLLERYAKLDAGHVIASLEPISTRSVERLGEAARQFRGG
jgi:alkanesulfonate monooxygenase SsuD/methylene tetrahydromethanopterin reductase-like flavin-dependent oxidoreductase (luciferase family)